MKKSVSLLFFQLCCFISFSQTGIIDNFNDNTLDAGWKISAAGKYTLTETGGQLNVSSSGVGPGYENISFSFASVNISANATVNIKIKNTSAFNLRVDLVDMNGNSNNAAPITKAIPINASLTQYTYTFTNFGAADKTKIVKAVFFVNAGGASTTNSFILDDVTIGDALVVTPGNVLVNQVGYELNGPKTAIYANAVNTSSATTFDLLNSANTVAYTGSLVYKGAVPGWTGRYFWEMDFSSFKQAGKYKVRVGSLISHEFEIGANILFSKTAFTVIDFFKGMRFTGTGDKTLSFNGPRNDVVNVYGGWRDATGDPGKHMSHLSYANYFNPQQIPFVVWSMLKSYEMSTSSFTAKSADLLTESKWGADYLLRNIDAQQNYLYLAVFDDWGNSPGSREICEWGQPGAGNDGARTPNYQAAMREGAGMAIAALARSYRMNLNGDSTKTQYLNGAIRLYNNLKAPGTGYATKNLEYCNDHAENIIDFYCGLLATIELYKATNNVVYLTDAGAYANKILSMQDPQGWFRSDVAGTRPFYHAADEGMPLITMMEYMDIDPSKNTAITAAINKNIAWYMSISKQVTNPFNYMREYYKPYTAGTLGAAQTAFFLPHNNETGYWWQGENARLASMTTALLMAGRKLNSQFVMGADSLSTYGVAQLDWILGKNPYDMCMMSGVGATTYPNYPAGTAIPNVTGGICNGITSKDLEETNIDFMPYLSSDWQNWRWIEQWLPHDAWFLLAVSSVEVSNNTPAVAPIADFTVSGPTGCKGAPLTITNTSTGNVTSYAWSFGAGASVATATTAGPHSVSWSTTGTKTISLTVNGTNTKTTTITITDIPAAAGTISLPASICANATSGAISVAAVSGATGYTWTVPSGATIASGTNTATITAAMGAAGGTIQVTPVNACGNGTAASASITVKTIPGGAGPVTGPSLICVNSSYPFSIAAVSGATSYTWSVTGDSYVSFGAGTPAISVQTGSVPGTLTVTPVNACGSGLPASLAITPTPHAAGPGQIIFPPSICAGSTGIVFSCDNAAGATSYTWSLPPGSVITSGDNTHSITATMGTDDGPVGVATNNACNYGSVSTAYITLNHVPSAAGSISIPASTCAGSTGKIFSVPAQSDATGYTWLLPSGSAITSGNNTNSIKASIGTTSGMIQVTPTNSCGNGTSSSATLTAMQKPAAAGTLSIPPTVCKNAPGIPVSVPADANATGYTWTLPTGTTITDGANTNAITLTAGTASGTITVTPVSGCGNGAAASATLTLTAVPSAPATISGPSSVCANATGVTYTASSVANATGYVWILPSSPSTSIGTNTPSISVAIGTTSGNVTIKASNSCGTSGGRSMAVTVIPVGTAPCKAPVTSAITGPATVSPNQTAVTYSVTANAGSTYVWTVPSGATMVSGQGTNSLVVNFGTSGGTISVTESNSFGAGNTVSLPVTMSISTSIAVADDISLILSPNPSDTYSTLHTINGTTETAHVAITDVNGRPVYTATWETAQTLDIGSGLAQGIYLVQISLGNHVITKRFIKL